GSRAFLEGAGFTGFRTVGQLHADRCEEIPNECGVYAIVRETADAPEFTRSSAPVWRRMDPGVAVDELEKHWVPNVELVYLGLASGTGVRSKLKQRVKRMLRFGHGKVVAHWGGRFVWQLRDRTALRVAWKPASLEDAARLDAELREQFVRRHGRLPFANVEHEIDE